MTTLTEFLLARIAEGEDEIISSAVWDDARQHRDLAECEAKRRIIELHAPYSDLAYEYTTCSACGAGPEDWCVAAERTEAQEEGRAVDEWWSWPCETLRLLALPYADHPDFRDEWRP